MRIDNWPLERIMRLPDWCFGQRWPIGLHIQADEIGSSWDISELALPEMCVLWELTFWSLALLNMDSRFRLALGHQLPTAVAQMNDNEPLIHGVGINGAEPRQMIAQGYSAVASRRLRKVIAGAGRKVILELTIATAVQQDIQLVMVFSSVPREVPDWLISAKAIDLT